MGVEPESSSFLHPENILMNLSLTVQNVSMTVSYRDNLTTAVVKNVIVVALCIIINYINGTLVHTFNKHQIFSVNPRYILFIHMVLNDMIQLTTTICMFVLSYVFYTINVSLCCLLVTLAVLTTLNTPFNLAAMAIECYIAICLPLRHVEVCTVKRTYILIGLIWVMAALTVIPDILIVLATEPIAFLYSRVFCERDTMFRIPTLIKKRDVSYILLLVMVWLTLVYTYFRILFAAKAAKSDAKKARNTILLHGFQLLLCMLTYIIPVLKKILLYWFPKNYTNSLFVCYIIVQILPRFLSPIVYGLRDQTFRMYLRRYLLCKMNPSTHPQASVKVLGDPTACLMNISSGSSNVTAVVRYQDGFNAVVTKNVIVVALYLSINYINGTLVHTFNKHQVSDIFNVNPRYVLFIHLVISDMIQLTVTVTLILFAAKAANSDAKKARNTILLHGFQLLLYPPQVSQSNSLRATRPDIQDVPEKVPVVQNEPKHPSTGLSERQTLRRHHVGDFDAFVLGDPAACLMNISSGSSNVTAVVRYQDGFNAVVTKNVIVVALYLSINYINGTLVHTFNKHQVSDIFNVNPRYVLFIHLVISDMIQLTVTVTLFILPRFLSPIVYGLRDQTFRMYLRRENNVTAVVHRDDLSTAVIKNVITVALCISINCINGTLVKTFNKHQIFNMNPRYILFIHLVINDMILLTLFGVIQVLSYILFTLNVSFCIFLLMVAIFANQNTPLTLAVMAVECYIAICLPLRHTQICTVRRTYIIIGLIWSMSALSVLPDLFVTLATEPLEFFGTRVFCLRETVFRRPYLTEKRDASYIVFLVLVWLTLFYTYFRILFAAKAAATDAKKARNTVLLHAFQLLLCMLTYVCHLVIKGLSNLFPTGVLAIRFTISVFIQILPRLISPIVYGLRDKAFRKYLTNYLLCSKQTTLKRPS
ncbi:uncharacterized protein ACJ7VT_011006 [Polymixia lowei]